jgi:hypothetical protein
MEWYGKIVGQISATLLSYVFVFGFRLLEDQYTTNKKKVLRKN